MTALAPFTTRIAPSPTGDMHIGTSRTAYFCYLAARASGGRFLLRIDDTDAARNDPAHTEVILRTMEWLGLEYDALIYQSARFDRHREVAESLVTAGRAKREDNGAISLVFDPEMPTAWTDDIAGSLPLLPRHCNYIDGMILVKGDGTPIYHFATVVDDIDTGVNFIIRGTDHIDNTFKHAAIYHALGVPLPRYAHVGLIHGPDGKKISKRDGAASMLAYRDSGVDPDAMLNYLLRLCWGPSMRAEVPMKDDKDADILPRERAIQVFLKSGHLKNKFATLDPRKLNWYDKQYKLAKGILRGRDSAKRDAIKGETA